MLTQCAKLRLLDRFLYIVCLATYVMISTGLSPNSIQPGIKERRYSYAENDVAVLLTNYFLTTGTIQAVRFLTQSVITPQNNHKILFGVLRPKQDEFDIFCGYTLNANFTHAGALEEVTFTLGTKMYEYNTSQVVWLREENIHTTRDVNVAPGDGLLYFAAEAVEGAVYFDIGENEAGCFPVYTLPYSTLQADGEIHISALTQVSCRMLSVEVDVCRDMT